MREDNFYFPPRKDRYQISPQRTGVSVFPNGALEVRSGDVSRRRLTTPEKCGGYMQTDLCYSKCWKLGACSFIYAFKNVHAVSAEVFKRTIGNI